MEFSSAVNRVLQEELIGYVAHGFRALGGQEPEDWQIGVYDTETDTVRVYTVTADGVHVSEPQEVYKDGGIVPELALDKILKPPREAVELAQSTLKEKYPGNPIMKTIVLVQMLDGRPMYNITVVTQTFNMFNAKICTETLDILSSSFDSIMSLRKEE